MFGTGWCCLPHILEGFHRHLPHTRVGITTGGPHTHLIVHLKRGPGILGGKIKTQGAASSNFGSQPEAAAAMKVHIETAFGWQVVVPSLGQAEEL